MKSIKLLAAFAIPAMFAACTNEEIAMESTQQLNQVVGAELIGTDISINVSNGVGSRLNAEGWQSTDKLGLAWIVNEDYSTPQDIKNAQPTLVGAFCCMFLNSFDTIEEHIKCK